MLLSTVIQDKPNIGTDQIVSLVATYTLSPADQAAAAAEIGRPLTSAGALQVDLLGPGDEYADRIRQWDLSAKKVFRFGGAQRLTVGVDIYNLTNSNVTLAFNPTFVPNTFNRLELTPTSYMNPRVFRLASGPPGSDRP